MNKKKALNTFRVRKELRKYLSMVLCEHDFKFTFQNNAEDNDYCLCITSCSGQIFHKCVMRALCDKKTEEELPLGMIFVTRKERDSELKLQSLMRSRNATAWSVLNSQ